MKIHAIVAAAKNGVIGKDNDIPWYLPADLKYFKKVTTGSPIIMGRKCFLSIGRPLPKRTNIIVTRNPFYAVSNAFVVHSLVEAFDLAAMEGANEAFVIGGGEIYTQALPFLDKIYYTEIDLEVEGDTFFPELPEDDWKLISEDPHPPDEKNPYAYNFKIYEHQ
ncbi:MAG: dihydrofolate reductase [Saprospiraceae bacterium]|nr:dihydrofolate reductase [Saprospiraceae bacterium]